MLFGLKEDMNETLSNKVGEVFVSVGENPSLLARNQPVRQNPLK